MSPARRTPAAGVALTQKPDIFERFHIDPSLLVLVLLLSALGLLVLYSANGQQLGAVARQATYFVAACLAMIGVAQISLLQFQRWSPWAYTLGIGLLLLVAFVGVGEGSQRWLALPGVRFQPSEIMKLLVPIILAWYLAPQALPLKFRHLVVCLLLIGLPSALVVLQPDLGTALLIIFSGLSVMFMAGLGWSYIFGGAVCLLCSAWPAWTYLLYDYQRQRILTVFNPERDRLGQGWNIIQSKTAVGSGGWSGKGWNMGTQSQLDFLPESNTDFIAAVLAEEFGFRGILLVLLLYVLILLRGCWISWRAQDSFSRLVAVGLTMTFTMNVFINMGMASGVLPVVGIPLPLISAGGTSLVTMLAGFGILMSISVGKKVAG